MTTTPPQDPTEPGADTGPRVSAAEARDLSRLRRTTGPDRHVAGVAGGLGRHLDVDPLLLRVAFVVLTVFGGAGLILYVGCWLLLPEDGADRAAVQLDQKVRDGALVVLAALGIVLVLGQTFGPGMGWPLALAAAVIGIVLLVKRDDATRASSPGYGPPPGTPFAPPAAAPGGQSAPATGPDATAAQATQPPGYQGPGYQGPARPAYVPRPPDPRKQGPVLFWLTVATVVLAWGVLGVVDVAGSDIPAPAYPALALAIIAGALLLASVWGRGGGLIAIGLVATLGLAASSVTSNIDTDPVTITPTEQVADRYSFGVVDHTLDLTRIDPERLDGASVFIEGGLGEIRVVLPDDVDVEATADVGLGDVTVLGQRNEGAGLALSATDDGEGSRPGEVLPEIEVRAQVGVGTIEIVREGDL